MFFRRAYHSLPPTVHQLLSRPFNEQNASVVAHGWLKSIRKQKNVAFAVLSDGSDPRGLQAVFTDPSMTNSLTNGTAVRVSGQLKPSFRPEQDRELMVSSVSVMGSCDISTYPIQKKTLTNEYLRDNVHLRARTDRIASMLRLRSACTRILHQQLDELGFMQAHTPILTGNDCEGAGEAFKLASVALHPSARQPLPKSIPSKPATPSTSSAQSEFFGRPAYLTVSSQLHLEALSWSMDRVFNLGPCFRAEHSMTGRHLAEFWMLEAEWNLTQENSSPSPDASTTESEPLLTVELMQICDVVEQLVKAILRPCFTPDSVSDRKLVADIDLLWKNSTVSSDRKEILRRAAQTDQPWRRMTYTEAIDILKSAETQISEANKNAALFEFSPDWGKPLQSEHERYLAEEVVQGPVFICNYPASMKPFYMRLNNSSQYTDNPDAVHSRSTVACFDLLVPGVGELAGGSVREERLPVLEASLSSLSDSWKQEYGWYADLRRYGGAPHGGFGLGFERLISWISGIESIRECIPVPRWSGRMEL